MKKLFLILILLYPTLAILGLDIDYLRFNSYGTKKYSEFQNDTNFNAKSNEITESGRY